MDVSGKALDNFSKGYNCAESVLLALHEGIPHSGGTCLPRIATGFGGGIARNGSLCGALTGGIMAIGLVLGRDDNNGSREPCYPAVDRLFNGFATRFGDCTCRGILGVDLKTAEGQKAHAAGEHREKCNSCVSWAAQNTQQIITEFSKGYSARA